MRPTASVRRSPLALTISSCAAIPANLPAQKVYFDYWNTRGVDVTPFFAALERRLIQ